ncbi:MAG: GNAT family N-acetyltransferase [Smithellaceae bacterium]|nr:GNAT family N-acetyltransferase [Smithellaceae bacterium]
MTGSAGPNYSITGYYPGIIGRIVELHAVYYHRHWGLDASFEIQMASELASFVAGFKEKRDGLWVASTPERLIGAVAIDGKDTQVEGARLRWFIVAPQFQGTGVGKRLIGLAIDHCRLAGYRQVCLWTFRGLEAARSIYEREGFSLACEHEISQWGKVIREQKFVMVL